MSLSQNITHTNQAIEQIKRQSFDLPAHWVQEWLGHVLDKPDTFLITNSDYKLSTHELKAFYAGINKMQAGMPLAYLIGKQEFWSLQFLVNEHTLIPRPDTEILVEHVLEWINKQYSINSLSSIKDNIITSPSKYKLLDLGTGTGCIAISLAHELEQRYQRQWQVTAVDYSEGAVAIANKNIALNNVNNVKVIKSDWFSALGAKDKKELATYEVIVSNPPYIAHKDKHLEDLKAEPLSALVADNQGLADIKKIISGSGDYLQADGLLAIEHGYNQGESVRQLFMQYGFNKVKTIKDYGNNERVTMGQSTPSDKV